MKLWLDDLRKEPAGYERAYSVNEAKDIIRKWESEGRQIELLDLDYDCGAYEKDGGTGMDFLVWLLERETFYPVLVHSLDAVACANMEGLVEAYWGETED